MKELNIEKKYVCKDCCSEMNKRAINQFYETKYIKFPPREIERFCYTETRFTKWEVDTEYISEFGDFHKYNCGVCGFSRLEDNSGLESELKELEKGR